MELMKTMIQIKKSYNEYIMSKLHQIRVSLTQGQKEKLARAYRNKEGVSIRLKHNALSGNDVLMVPNNTVKRVAKNRNDGCRSTDNHLKEQY